MNNKVKTGVFIWVLLMSAFFAIIFAPTKTVSELGESFWKHHNLIQLIGWVCFPRMMFWFFSVITGGAWFWVGVLFAPYIMAAYWATQYYWDTNPVLCVFAWIFAVLGSIGESKTVT